MRSENSFDIVCIAQPSWDGPYAKSTVLLMKELAQRNRVLYVDYAFTWKDFFKTLLKKQKAPLLQMMGLKDRIRVIQKKGKEVSLAVLTLPPLLPINFLPHGWLYRLLNKINSLTASLSIHKAMERMKFDKPVVINAFSPALGLGLLHRLDETLTLYYCYDEIKEAEWSGKHGGAMEKEFAAKADAIIVSSDSLSKEKVTLNHETFVVKNGVDINFFQPSAQPVSKAEAVPVVGFVGSLDSRIDYALLKDLITHSPELHFRFIGRVVDSTFESLQTLPNVEWIAPVAYNQLPLLIEKFDVGIIPFVISPFTEKIYPLKINEYLAMGKPVVMTSFAALPEFDTMAVRADSGATFKAAIHSALKTDNLEKHSQREEFARKNSWQERAKEFNRIIETVGCEKD
jgi:glycosyltransferase involved in cell wall biosynthesis